MFFFKKKNPEIDKRVKCPCCGYPTLSARCEWEICILCDWEDDGQDNPHEDAVWGGPNGWYSLSEARRNFKKYLVMYSPDNDTRITKGDSPEQKLLKQQIVDAFEEIATMNDQVKIGEKWSKVIEYEKKLGEILGYRLRQYEEQAIRNREV